MSEWKFYPNLSDRDWVRSLKETAAKSSDDAERIRLYAHAQKLERQIDQRIRDLSKSDGTA